MFDPAATTQSGIGTGVVVLTLAAAVLHATWNAIAHAVDDRLVGFTLMGITHTVGGGALALYTGPPSAEAWPYIGASAALHVAYILALLTSYQLGEFSQMYPLARGTSPWVVALVSIVVLDRQLPAVELAGVLTVSGGLLGIVLVGGRPTRAQFPALTAALVTGLFIAAYTVVDGTGVAHTPVLTYTGWLFLLQGPVIPLIALARRGRRLGAQLRPVAAPGLTGGLVSLLAYGLVLVAQTSGALAPVAALRETSIVIGALIGRAFLGERLGSGRAVAAAVIVVGIVLVSVG